MMFADSQNDAHTGFGTDDKSDDVNSYGGYLHDDLQTAIEHDPEEPEDVDINPAALVEPRDVSVPFRHTQLRLLNKICFL